jgi:peroxiredoxin
MLPKYVLPLKNKLGLTFPMLLDPGNRVAEEFGLAFTFPETLQQLYLSFGIDLSRYNGDDSWRLPLPARYVIDQKGVIRDATVSVDYTDRPDIEKTLAALKELTG